MVNKRRKPGIKKYIDELDQQFDAWNKGEKSKSQKLGNASFKENQGSETIQEQPYPEEGYPYEIKIDNVFAVNPIRADNHFGEKRELEQQNSLKIATCYFCGVEFKTIDPGALYCSIDCRQKALLILNIEKE